MKLFFKNQVLKYITPALTSIIFSLVAPSPSLAFVVSAESCNSVAPYSSERVYEVYFSIMSGSGAYNVQVSEAPLYPDIKIKLTNNPREANLVLVDNYSAADMKICKKNYGLGSGIITINTGSYMVDPDVTIELSSYVYNPDYVLFVDSSEFTNEQAAAFL